MHNLTGKSYDYIIDDLYKQIARLQRHLFAVLIFQALLAVGFAVLVVTR